MGSGEAVRVPVITSTWLLLTWYGPQHWHHHRRPLGSDLVGGGVVSSKWWSWCWDHSSVARALSWQAKPQRPLVWMWWLSHAYYPRLGGRGRSRRIGNLRSSSATELIQSRIPETPASRKPLSSLL